MKRSLQINRKEKKELFILQIGTIFLKITPVKRKESNAKFTDKCIHNVCGNIMHLCKSKNYIKKNKNIKANSLDNIFILMDSLLYSNRCSRINL